MKWLPIVLVVAAIGIVECNAQEDEQALRREQIDRMQPQMVMMRLMSAMHSEIMQKELEIIPDQLEELKEAMMEFQREFQQVNQKMMEQQLIVQELVQNGQHEEAMAIQKELMESQSEVSKKHYAKIEDFLLPHQLKRITQIAKQEMYKHVSGYGDEFGLPLAIADELELSSREQQQLREAIEDAREKYYEEVAELKKETHAEILDAIPADKRDRVKEILGDIYEIELEQRRARQPSRPRRPNERQQDEKR